MKTLNKMGLVSLTHKETMLANGGSNNISILEKYKIDVKVCCYNIPPIEFSQEILK